MSDIERGPVTGYQKLTMAEQMRAASKSGKLHTNPMTGAVENPRREYIKQVAAAKGSKAPETC